AMMVATNGLKDIKSEMKPATADRTKSQEKRQAELGAKYQTFAVNQKRELKTNAAKILKDILNAAHKNEVDSMDETEHAFEAAIDSQPKKRWSFQIIGHGENRSTAEPPKADARPSSTA